MEAKYTRIILPESVRGSIIKTAAFFPYSYEVELGGYITSASIYYKYGTFSNVAVPPDKAIVFHTHPPKRDGDLPSELDILNMIFTNWSKSIILTQNRLIIISATKKFRQIAKTIDERHEKNAIEAATLLKEKGADSLFYFIVKTIFRKQMHNKNITHRTWKEKWEDFVRNELKLDIRTLYCEPVKAAA